MKTTTTIDQSMIDTTQINAVTKKPYLAGNEARLIETKNLYGFISNQWLTFCQAYQAGRKIKKGSKGTRIVLIARDKKENKKHYAGTAVLFNYDQTEKR